MIPFVDLKAQYAGIKTEVNAAIQGVLDSCQFTLGTEVAKFEEEFAAYSGAKHGIGVNTGTSALHLALLAADIGPGDEVITVPFTFVATVAAIYYTGATPVFVDIDPRTFTMDPAALEAAITPRTKAIMPVHLYGQCADMDPILAIARKHKLAGDRGRLPRRTAPSTRAAAPAAWATWPASASTRARTWAPTAKAAWSLPTIAEYARTIRMLRDWGAEKKYQHVLKGYNFRLEGIQGAVLRVKLRHLETWTEARRAAAARYDRELAGSGVPTPEALAHNRHVYHIYAIRTAHRQAWMDALATQGIQTGIHYPIPVHLLPAYADLGYEAGQFPHSEQAANEVLSLPMFPELTAEQTSHVSAAVWSLAAGKIAKAS